MKKAIAISLILTFLFNLTGSFVILHLRHYELRREMLRNIKNGVSSARVTKITVTAENQDALRWEGEDEFRYKGVWYDVVNKERLPDQTIIYHCLADHKDTNLFTEIVDLMRKQQKDAEKGKIPIKHLYKIQQFCPSDSKDFVWLPFGESQKHTFSYLLLYSSPKLKNESPPPKIFLSRSNSFVV